MLKNYSTTLNYIKALENLQWLSSNFRTLNEEKKSNKNGTKSETLYIHEIICCIKSEKRIYIIRFFIFTTENFFLKFVRKEWFTSKIHFLGWSTSTSSRYWEFVLSFWSFFDYFLLELFPKFYSSITLHDFSQYSAVICNVFFFIIHVTTIFYCATNVTDFFSVLLNFIFSSQTL